MHLTRFLLAAFATLATATTAPAEPTQLTGFDAPFTFTYLGFDDAVSVENGHAIVKTRDGKGGAGIVMERDWSAFADHSPALTLRLGAGNKASQIKLQITDAAEGKATFAYDLSQANPTGFTRLTPVGGPPLASPGLDIGNVASLHIQGDWRPEPVDLIIDRVDFIPPTPEMLTARNASAEKEHQQAERKRQQAQREAEAREAVLRDGADHPADGPELVHIGAAGTNLIGIQLQAGRVNPSAPVPYTPQKDDVLKHSDKMKLAWQDGVPALVPAGTEVRRSGRKIDQLNTSANTVWSEHRTGAELDLDAVDDPRAYRVTIGDATPVTPAAVYRKTKPNTVAQVSGEIAAVHFIYLELAAPLTAGTTYTVTFHALNTRDASASFTHDSRTNTSEAVHVSHLGFRPTDPLKRAYLSLWAGTGGNRTFPATTFELLGTNGATVFTGTAKLAVPADQSEPFANARNHTAADVYHLDFSAFQQPGSYTVHVPGLGCSDTFTIGNDTWTSAFKTSMHGFLAHRSGIELGPPFTSYRRPRPMHPADGFTVFESGATIWDGEADAIAADLKKQLGDNLDPSRLETVPDAWGGYQDAGDWDRRSQHLIASVRHLELFELFPDKFTKLSLALPPAEAANDIPDLIDEALWNIDFYRRLQRQDGGVRGGIESTDHPRPAEASWQETLLAAAFRPDPETSFRYAAAAAKAARLLGDHPRASPLAASAKKAWTWAANNAETETAAAVENKSKGAKNAGQRTAAARALAAAELYHLTADTTYHDDFLATGNDVTADLDIAMAYALIPAARTDANRRAACVKAITGAADSAIDFANQNGFNIALASRHIPMMGYTCIWSTPGSTTPPVLPRAHFLTQQEKYLAATVAACQYSAGANPMNMTFTTGIGHRWPLAPLHIDSRASGQPAPAGITVYGQSDPSMGYGFDSFAHTWFLNRFGGVHSSKWPTAEAYIDLGNWPAMNEYTIHQTLSPTSYTWGYLAARP